MVREPPGGVRETLREVSRLYEKARGAAGPVTKASAGGSYPSGSNTWGNPPHPNGFTTMGMGASYFFIDTTGSGDVTVCKADDEWSAVQEFAYHRRVTQSGELEQAYSTMVLYRLDPESGDLKRLGLVSEFT